MADPSVITLTPPPASASLDSSMQALGHAAQAKQAPRPAPVSPSPAPQPDITDNPLTNAVKAKLQPQMDELDQRLAGEDAQIDYYQGQQQAAWGAMQRQRLVTINRAQILRKVLPVVGLFTLLAGAKGGSDAALAALGGGLAGLQSGMEKQFQNAWQQYKAEYQKMDAHAKAVSAQLKEVLEDRTKTATQKMDLARAITATVPAFYRARLSAENEAENRAAADERHLQTMQLELAKFDWQRQQAAKAFGGADAGVSAPTSEDVQAAAAAIDPTGAGKGGKIPQDLLANAMSVASAARAVASVKHLSQADALTDVVATMRKGRMLGKPMTAQAIERKMGVDGGEGGQGGGLSGDGKALYGAMTLSHEAPYISHFNAGYIIPAMNSAAAQLRAAGINPANFGEMFASEKARSKALSTLTNQAAVINRNIETLDLDSQLMLHAADKVGLTRFPTYNSLKMFVERNSGDPSVSKYLLYVNTVVDAYARVMSNGTGAGATAVGFQNMAYSRIRANAARGQLSETVDALKQDADNQAKATNDGIDLMTQSLSRAGLSRGMPNSSVQGGGSPGLIPGIGQAPGTESIPEPGTAAPAAPGGQGWSIEP